MAYDPTKDFFVIPGTARFANGLVRPQLAASIQGVLDKNGYITWTFYKKLETGGTLRPPTVQTSSADLCFQFALLSQGSEDEIMAFSERWGPLGFEARADEQIPAKEPPRANQRIPAEEHFQPRHIRAEEHIDDWRRYATLAAALLRFTADHHRGHAGDEKDWRIICSSTIAKEVDRQQLNSRQVTSIVALAVNTWFAKAHGHRILDLVGHQLQVRPAASNLFGVLIMQIAHVLARTDEAAVCAGCNYPFRPKHRLRRGDRQYCKPCRKKKVPQRDASRDYRRRMGQQRSGQAD